MKKCILMLLLLFMGHLGYCPNNKKTIKNPLIGALYAIIEQESRWNTKVINYNEVALGALQIRKMVIDDVNRYYNEKYSHADVFDINIAMEIFWKYQKIYHKQLTPEIMARTWVGGPKGIKKKSSVKYWKEVERRIKNYE